MEGRDFQEDGKQTAVERRWINGVIVSSPVATGGLGGWAQGSSEINR